MFNNRIKNLNFNRDFGQLDLKNHANKSASITLQLFNGKKNK